MTKEIIDFLIIGGGVAGLAVANSLIDAGCSPVVLEAKNYPAHKVCGEFISPEALPQLCDWGIYPSCYVDQTTFFLNKKTFTFQLPSQAANFSRYELDQALVQRIRHKNGQVLTGIEVINFCSEQSHYLISLSNGDSYRAKSLFIGAGRLCQPLQAKPLFSYIGFKAHFSGIDIGQTLEMHLLPQAYLGLSQVAPGIINAACLAKVNDLNSKNPKAYIERLLTQSSIDLQQKLKLENMIFKDWLYAFVPTFSVKSYPPLKNVYYIGDAAGTIPPATGGGLGMAITSGCLAAKYALQQNSQGYLYEWKKRYQRNIWLGKLLHQMMLNSLVSRSVFYLCQSYPKLVKKLFQATRFTNKN